MPWPFNRTPRGLLGLLDAKVGGRNPQELSDDTQAVLDLYRHYYAQKAETIVDATGVINAEGFFQGNGVLLVVPQSELWLCDKFTVEWPVTLGATEIISLRPAVRRLASGGANADFLLCSQDAGNQSQFSTGARPVAAADRPFIGLPGDNFGVYISAHVAAASTCNLFMEAARLQI